MPYDMIDGDGVITRNVREHTVYVNDENDLDAFDAEPAGTVAVQYGMGAMWQKKPDGTWAEM